MAHTPGPWKYDLDDCAITFVQQKADGWHSAGEVRNVVSLLGAMGSDNSEADARLIAAAPDLLEALTACEAQFRFYQDEHEKAGKAEKAATNKRFADLARDAIAKATKP